MLTKENNSLKFFQYIAGLTRKNNHQMSESRDVENSKNKCFKSVTYMLRKKKTFAMPSVSLFFYLILPLCALRSLKRYLSPAYELS